MKKLILTLASLFVLTTGANAQCTLKPQYPGSGAAPKAYCWDVLALNSQQGGFEWTYQRGKYATSKNHGGNWSFGQFKNYFVAYVNVYGYGKTPDLKMNYKNGYLYRTYPLTNRYNIVTGYQYVFIMPQNSSNVKGALEVKEYWNTKDYLYVR